MGRLFATSDIHGRHDRFIKLLDQLKLKGDDKLYVLGDVIDRGEDSIKTLCLIKEHPHIELLMGNHEVMLLDYVKSKEKGHRYAEMAERMWFQNGGDATLKEFMSLTESEQQSLVDYVKGLPLYKVVGSHVLVHAGLETFYSYKTLEELLEHQKEEDLLWIREEFFRYEGVKGYTIVFGHTPTPNMYAKINKTHLEKGAPFSVWVDPVYGDKIGIDCGAILDDEDGGRLACLDLKTHEVLYA